MSKINISKKSKQNLIKKYGNLQIQQLAKFTPKMYNKGT